MKEKLYRLFLRVAHAVRLLSLWSWLYWVLFDRAYRKIPVKKHEDFKEAVEDICRLRWVNDGLRELTDVIRHPGWVEVNRQRVASGRSQLPGALDCDDFALWLAASLQDFWNPLLLFVNFMETREGKERRGGHAVALIRYGDEYYHLGNWGTWGPFPSITEVITSIANPVFDRRLVYWAIYDAKLQQRMRGDSLRDVESLRTMLNTHFSKR